MEFEGNREEPGRWEELTAVHGAETTVLLPLAPYVRYQFRVVAVNEVGRSAPSRPSDHHETPPAGACPRRFPRTFSLASRLPPKTVARGVRDFRCFPRQSSESSGNEQHTKYPDPTASLRRTRRRADVSWGPGGHTAEWSDAKYRVRSRHRLVHAAARCVGRRSGPPPPSRAPCSVSGCQTP